MQSPLCSPLVLAALVAGPLTAAGDEPPHQATRRLLREVVTRGDLATWVRAGDGLVVIDRSQGASDEPPLERRLCQRRDVAAYLRRLGVTLQAYVADDTIATIGCANRGGPPRCWLDGIGEFAPRITLEFADDPTHGLTLRAVIALDLNGSTAPFVTEEARAVRVARRRLDRTTCPRPSPGP